jgi:Protein of unknown function (DUF1116)
MSLFDSELHVVNVGIGEFAGPIRQAGASVRTLEWRPPAEGDVEAGLALARLTADPAVEEANQLALRGLLGAQPVLAGVVPAATALPVLRERALLHAGPPIGWDRMCGPVKGAVVGAILLEGWAETPEAAERLAASGTIGFEPAHHHGAVGPMAGIISPSMPLLVVEDAATGRRTYSNINEGLGKALRFGANDVEVLDRLRWMAARLGPVLQAALQELGEPLNLKAITAQALQMGDECHNRNVAATSMVARTLAPALARHASEGGIEALEFMRDNNHFFLNLSMAACKLMAGAAEGIAGSTVVTTMARNGVEFGLRVSGAGDRWFTAPAAIVDGLYFPGYGPADANPDLGDSAITETAGLGGFAMAAAPAITGFVGGTVEDATGYSLEMMTVTVGRNPEYQLPALGFAGTPTGIDVRRVLDANTPPVINTGIAHREAGVGQIGAGIARAPLSCFRDALLAIAEGRR